MESRKLPAKPEIPAEIEELCGQIERWRQVRHRGERMPEHLWEGAARLARRHSVARVSRLVRLDYYTLKERLGSLDRDSVIKSEKRPAFIELAMPLSTSGPECVIELEHPRRGRMRIHVKGAGVPDLAAISRSFWSAES